VVNAHPEIRSTSGRCAIDFFRASPDD
jgi:hypothetical protein